ncbi:MAG: FtsX-like permease family protein [Bacteroidetes bacterium]|jgi:putative ABC transport system permease protein|nr:FtsX-like permease family protein [Bacteroidota bacterium]MBT6685151.1 FtsX-like permease family protein [Bacteroidota bacterium]MBT7142062.1 FtsX-like permease family protein [Bacteroidota bacterium]MBT7493384.1 FtsX-like permease family protein [Bacteroidota bacterium]
MVNRFLLFENIKIAFQSIRSNLLRTILTICIIAVGITALVGILTTIDAMKFMLSNQFASMGTNTFSIEKRYTYYQGNTNQKQKTKKSRSYLYISYKDAIRFKSEYNFPSNVSIYTWASYVATVKYESKKTDPNIRVNGTDENYIQTAGREIWLGRNFTVQDIEMNRNVTIIGSELARNIFGKNTDPLDKIITIGNGKYKVIGVLTEKGSTFGGNEDKICLLPITNVRQYFSRPNMDFTIKVAPKNEKLLDIAVGEARGCFRKIRKLELDEEDNFRIEKMDQLLNTFFEDVKFITLSATIIGVITLLGAVIGLMNIMLVSVSERTREIGTRKAIGAKSVTIKQQFLLEAIIIGQLGGIFGIILGIVAGNIVTMLMDSNFYIPWVWISFGIAICFIVGILSGYIPAVKASKLDPINALRYE